MYFPLFYYFNAQTLKSMSQGCCRSDIRVFRMPVHEKKFFLNSTNFTPFCPLLGPKRAYKNLVKINSVVLESEYFKSISLKKPM